MAKERWVALMLAAVMLLGIGSALADQQVQLPESRYALTLPDEMDYDGPGDPGLAEFAYVSEKLGLEVYFILSDAKGMEDLADLIPGIRDSGMDEVRMVRLNGIDMLTYRYTPEDPGEMKGIGYILRDGERVVEIVFWYAGRKAADLTRTIMESIEDTAGK